MNLATSQSNSLPLYPYINSKPPHYMCNFHITEVTYKLYNSYIIEIRSYYYITKLPNHIENSSNAKNATIK